MCGMHHQNKRLAFSTLLTGGGIPMWVDNWLQPAILSEMSVSAIRERGEQVLANRLGFRDERVVTNKNGETIRSGSQ